MTSQKKEAPPQTNTEEEYKTVFVQSSKNARRQEKPNLTTNFVDISPTLNNCQPIKNNEDEVIKCLAEYEKAAFCLKKENEIKDDVIDEYKKQSGKVLDENQKLKLQNAKLKNDNDELMKKCNQYSRKLTEDEKRFVKAFSVIGKSGIIPEDDKKRYEEEYRIKKENALDEVRKHFNRN